ncbi:MAG: hypothetical protein M3Q82_07540 [Actinomycetota bacterium]|nr:hypothetical protein [Actinomycetota bacterium]
MSNYLEEALGKQLCRNTAGPTPATVWVSLHTADPTDAGSGAEVTGGAYARVSCTTGTSGTGVGSIFNAPTNPGGLVENASAITFPSPIANWGTVTHFGIWDAATVGNLLIHGALTTSRTINNGDSAPSFAVGELDITFA